MIPCGGRKENTTGGVGFCTEGGEGETGYLVYVTISEGS